MQVGVVEAVEVALVISSPATVEVVAEVGVTLWPVAVRARRTAPIHCNRVSGLTSKTQGTTLLTAVLLRRALLPVLFSRASRTRCSKLHHDATSTDLLARIATRLGTMRSARAGTTTIRLAYNLGLVLISLGLTHA